PNRTDAFLWPHASRSGQPALSMADARARESGRERRWYGVGLEAMSLKRGSYPLFGFVCAFVIAALPLRGYTQQRAPDFALRPFQSLVVAPRRVEERQAQGVGSEPSRGREPNHDRLLQQQAETDKTWRAASDGFMQMDKIAYRSRVGDMDIPAFVFQ